MDAWIDLRHSIRQLARRGTPVFLTDNAVGAHEEENLTHLSHNLGREMGWDQVVPFLTCKHPLEYCLMFARRAAAIGFPAVTVLGGDASVGPPRCVPHAYQLRTLIREQSPGIALGGWANPHRDPAEQVGFIASDEFEAEFVLTQVVSHHSIERVERFLEAHARVTPDMPVVFGVFYYRSANPTTLDRLSRFFPVPADEVRGEFASGATPDEICARTVQALRDVGAEKIYVSNLGFRRVDQRLDRILATV
jgi:5,10-methylenetetrahydrofolate reductase